jgi:hypothetical protein
LGEGSTTKSLTKAEARPIAANIAKLPELLSRHQTWECDEARGLLKIRAVAALGEGQKTADALAVYTRDRGLGPSTSFLRSRRCMNFANAIPLKTNRHNTTKIMMPFIVVGRFSGNLAVVSIAR